MPVPLRVSRTQAALEARRLIVCRLRRGGMSLRLIQKVLSTMTRRHVALGTVFADVEVIEREWVPKVQRLGTFFDPPDVRGQKMADMLTMRYWHAWVTDRNTRARLIKLWHARRDALVGWDSLGRGLLDIADVIRNEQKLQRGEWPPRAGLWLRRENSLTDFTAHSRE